MVSSEVSSLDAEEVEKELLRLSLPKVDRTRMRVLVGQD